MFRRLIDTIREMIAATDARSLVVKVGVALALIGIITVFADWRLNSRLDRSGLEKLAVGTAAADTAAGRKAPKR